MKNIGYILASILLMIFCFGCTSKKTSPNTLRFRLHADPPSLDWTLATDNVSKEVIAPMQFGLVKGDPKAEIVPAMAESWTISKDAKTYTFKLRENLKWSDGQPLVAQQFVDGWERLLTPKTAAEYAYFIFDVVNAQQFNEGKITDFSKVGVKAVDARTLVVTLTKAVSFWINIPMFWVTFPIRKDIIEKFGDKWTEPGNLVSAGPYKLIGRQSDSLITLDKNPNFYDQEVLKDAPEKIEFRIVKDDTTAVTLFNNGDLDIVRNLPTVLLNKLSSRSEFIKSPYYRGYYVGFNTKDPVVQNPKIRQALAMAIDRNELQSVIGSRGNITKGWIPRGLIGYNADRGIGYDPVKAKELWDSIPDHPKSIDYWFDQQEFNKLIAENLQSQWKKNLGLEVVLSAQEWKVYLKSLRSKTPSMFRLGWGADYPDPDTFMNLFTCASGNNYTGLCSMKYDTAIKDSAASQDLAFRTKSYDDAQKILVETDIAIMPLFTENNLHLVSKRTGGFKVNQINDIPLEEIRINLK